MLGKSCNVTIQRLPQQEQKQKDGIENIYKNLSVSVGYKSRIRIYSFLHLASSLDQAVKLVNVVPAPNSNNSVGDDDESKE